MASVRDSLAAEAKIGSVSFYATSASGPGAMRRIMQYTGVGVDGAFTEDLGADARIETLTGTVDETVYINLNKIKEAGKVVTCTHPLFFTMEARVQNVTYQANPNDMVDISVTLIEHGVPAILFAPNSKNISSGANDAKGTFDDLSGDLDDLDDLPLPDDLSGKIDAFKDGWDDFEGVLDNAEEGIAVFEEVAAGFSEFAQTANDLIESVENAADEVAELVEYTINDSIYEIIDAGRDVVNAMEQQVGEVWQAVTTTGPVSIAELALEYLGTDDDDAIQQILDRNPSIMDVSAVVPGSALSIPVA